MPLAPPVTTALDPTKRRHVCSALGCTEATFPLGGTWRADSPVQDVTYRTISVNIIDRWTHRPYADGR